MKIKTYVKKNSKMKLFDLIYNFLESNDAQYNNKNCSYMKIITLVAQLSHQTNYIGQV